MAEGTLAEGTQTAGGPSAASVPPGRRRWAIAAAGTAVAVLGAAALMQVWRGEEGAAAEGRATVGKAAVGDAAPASRPKHVARVGDAVILYDQVADEAMSRYGQEVLDQLINRTIIELACRDRGVVVTEAEVEQEISTIAQEFGLDRTAWLQMLQAERNITPLQYKRDIVWPMLALKKLAGTDVQVTDADIQRAFARDYGPRVKCRMIMLDNQRRMQDVWTKANEARAAAGRDAASPDEAVAKAAAEFGRLAREHSMEPTSKSLDGAVPPIRKHAGQENLENAAFALKPGEVSGIVQLPLPGAARYVVLFCEGHTESTVRPDQIDLVRDDIVAQLKKEKVQESVASVFTQIKEKTPVHNFLTNTSTGGVTPAVGGTSPGFVRPTAATAPESPVRR